MKGKNFLFVGIAVVILLIAGVLLFGKDIPFAKAQSLIKTEKIPTEFLIDGIFNEEDISEYSPLPDHKDYLEVGQYASYCKDLQNSARYSSNIYTNAFLSMKRYIAPEEVPVYDKFLKDAPTSPDPRSIVMSTIASNWKDHPELNEQGDIIMKIVSECK